MKMNEIFVPIISTTIGVIGGMIKTRLSYNRKSRERETIVKILKEIEELKLDDEFRKTIVDEYKRVVIKDIKGIDIVPKKYDLILKSGILDKYSNSQIKISNKFFDYSGKFLNVKIPILDKVISFYYLVVAILLIIISGFLYTIAFYSSLDFTKYVALIGLSIVTMLYGFYTVWFFSTPANIARLIKKDLDKMNDEENKEIIK